MWFEDEARFGQKSTLTKVWARKGSRPTMMNQSEYGNIHVVAAACPETGQAEATCASKLNSGTMSEFLTQLGQRISSDKHVFLILDRASYHRSKSLKIPSNVKIVHLPPYSPELNPIENLWHYLRSHCWSNRIYKDAKALYQAAEDGWNSVCLKPGKVKTICAVHYVH